MRMYTSTSKSGLGLMAAAAAFSVGASGCFVALGARETEVKVLDSSRARVEVPTPEGRTILLAEGRSGVAPLPSSHPPLGQGDKAVTLSRTRDGAIATECPRCDNSSGWILDPKGVLDFAEPGTGSWNASEALSENEVRIPFARWERARRRHRVVFAAELVTPRTNVASVRQRQHTDHGSGVASAVLGIAFAGIGAFGVADGVGQSDAFRGGGYVAAGCAFIVVGVVALALGLTDLLASDAWHSVPIPGATP